MARWRVAPCQPKAHRVRTAGRKAFREAARQLPGLEVHVVKLWVVPCAGWHQAL